MMSLVYIFWMYVILFGIIGMLRGWAKELLVAFSVIVALTLNHVLRQVRPGGAAAAGREHFAFLGPSAGRERAGVLWLPDRGPHPPPAVQGDA